MRGVEVALAVSVAVLAVTLAVLWMWVLRVQRMVEEAGEAVASVARGLGQLQEVMREIPGAPRVVLDTAMGEPGSWRAAPVGTESVVMVRARPWRVKQRDAE